MEFYRPLNFASTNPVAFTSMRPAHIECLCRALELQENIVGMERLLSELELGSLSRGESQLYDHSYGESLLRAKSFLLFHQQRFDELYELLSTHQFAAENHPFLQQLWNDAHYLETEQQRGKVLDAVSRYRVRKKNPFPTTIWDGECTSYCFKTSAIAALKEAYRKTKIPSQEHKLRLAELTDLSVEQVTNWFKNQRQRAKVQLMKQRTNQQQACSEEESEFLVETCESNGSGAYTRQSMENGNGDHVEDDDRLIREHEANQRKSRSAAVLQNEAMALRDPGAAKSDGLTAAASAMAAAQVFAYGAYASNYIFNPYYPQHPATGQYSICANHTRDESTKQSGLPLCDLPTIPAHPTAPQLSSQLFLLHQYPQLIGDDCGSSQSTCWGTKCGES